MEVIKLNLIPNGASPVAHASQYDEGRRFRCDLFEGAEVYTLDGTEVLECDIKKPDGNIVTVAVTNTSDSYIVVETTLQMCACAGNSFGEIKITKGAKVIGTLNFILAVERSPLEGGIESDSGIHNLQEQIGEAVAEQYSGENVIFDSTPTAGHGVGFAVTSEGLKTELDKKADTDDLAPVATSGDYNDLDNLPTIPENLPDLGDVEITSPTAGQIIEYDDNAGKWKNVANPASTTNFGAPYDENTTYNVPSLVIQNNLLYELNEGEVDVTGPFDPTKWTQTSVAELATAIGALSQLTTDDKSSLVKAINEVNGKQKIFAVTPSNVSVAPGSFVTLATLTVTRGVYVVNGFHEWTEGFGDYYIDRIGTNYERNLLGRAGGGHSTVCIINVTAATATLEYFTYLEGSTSRTAKTISFQAVKVM